MKTKLLFTLLLISLQVHLFAQEPGSGYTLDFDGANDYIDASTNAWFPDDQINDYTYEAWINMDDVTTLQGVVNYAWDVNTNEPHSGLWITGGQLQTRQRNQNTGTYFVNMSGGTISIGQWTHVALTKISNTYTIYVNGVSVNSTTVPSIPGIFTGRNKFTIGSLWNSSTLQGPLNGNIDEVRIWKKGLTPTELRNWMCRKVTSSHPQYTDLAHYYKLDEGTGISVADETGTNNAITHANFGPAPTWVTSGAPIGDRSSNSYGTGNATFINHTHADGSSLTIDRFTGVPLGAHVFLVNDTMNSTTNTLSGDLELTRYYGTFIVGGTSPTYNMQYNYAGNSNLVGAPNESEIRLVKRNDNSVNSWTTESKAFDLSTTTNGISVCGQMGNSEYAAGFDNGSTLIQRSGSGYAMEFSGSNHVNIPQAAAFNLTSFTVSAWVKTSQANTAYRRLISKPNGGGQNYSLAINNGKAHIRFDNGAGRQAESSTSVNDGNWHHLAGTYDHATNTISIYVDGTLEQTNNTGSNAPMTGTEGIFIGRFSNVYTGNYTGLLDEATIFSKALAQTEIRDWMCKKIKSNHPSYCNIVAYYRFDENNGTTLTDYKGSHNGTLVGSPAYELSGAPVGDESVHAYAVTTLSGAIGYATSNGDSMTARLIAGTSDAMHLYYVNEAPNATTAPSGFSNISAMGHWGVKLLGSTGGIYEVEYNYDGHPLIFNEDSLGLASRDNNADTSWTKEMTSVLNTTNSTLTLGGQTGTQFILGGGAVNPLPIELIEFNAILTNQVVRLDWRTASEINNDFFTIERSSDGIHFNPIMDIKSLGNSNAIQAYLEYDLNPKSGINFYRIKQTDYNGETTYGPIQTVTISSKNEISVYPNPTDGNIYINEINSKQITGMLITNIEGKIIKQWKDLNTNSYELNLVQQGVYFLQIEFINGKKEVVQLVKQ